MKSLIRTMVITLLLSQALLISPHPVVAADWTDSVVLKGDVRLRYETIDQDGAEDRKRARFRARFGLSAKVNDDVDAIIRLATGGDSPISTNQSFDNGFSKKDIALDQAYLVWKPNDTLTVYGGKMKNPLMRSGGHALVWDSDLNPEGIAAKYKSGIFFGTLGGFVVEERSAASDSFLIALQGGVNYAVSETGTLTTGLSYFDYSEAKGQTPFFDGGARGNTLDANGNLMFDFRELEFFAQYDSMFRGQPFSVFADYVKNTEATNNDIGYAIGAKLGKVKAPGTWQVAWAWQELEADAVIGTFTDSDFGGGGTDAKGHVLNGKYALAKNWTAAATVFLNESDISLVNDRDFSRVQLDVEFKF